MRKCLILASFVVCLFSLAPNIYACSCVTPEVPQAFREAKAVFLGEVVEIIEPRTKNPKAPLADRLFGIKFKVERAWKGTATKEIIILSDQGRAGCFSWGPFLKDRKYLVYAERRTPSGERTKDLVVLFSCNRTGLLANAAEDLKMLDMMKPGIRLKRLGSASSKSSAPILDNGTINIERSFQVLFWCSKSSLSLHPATVGFSHTHTCQYCGENQHHCNPILDYLRDHAYQRKRDWLRLRTFTAYLRLRLRSWSNRKHLSVWSNSLQAVRFAQK